MPALAVWLMPPKATIRLGRLLGVLVCTLALTLAVIGHTDFAGAAFTSSATQTTSNHGSDDGVDSAIGLAPHCAQHSTCGPLMLALAQEAAPAEGGLLIAIAPNTSGQSRPTVPPYHPPQT